MKLTDKIAEVIDKGFEANLIQIQDNVDEYIYDLMENKIPVIIEDHYNKNGELKNKINELVKARFEAKIPELVDQLMNDFFERI